MLVQIKLIAQTDKNIIGLKEEIAAELEKLGVVSVLVTDVQPVQTRLGEKC
mgnify:CR=1 FL=1